MWKSASLFSVELLSRGTFKILLASSVFLAFFFVCFTFEVGETAI